MNPVVKAKWLEALRSKQYNQAVNTLRCDSGFCCLGVLTDLYHKETGRGKWDRGTFVWDDGYGEFARECITLPRVVKLWAGLDHNDPPVVALGFDAPPIAAPSSTRLSMVNDSGQPFEYIAKIIEEQL